MRRSLVASFAVLALTPGAASAANIPVLTPQVAAGGGTTVQLRAAFDTRRTVDGNPSDWHGYLPGFGGAMDYSRGELVYEDHIFDAYGADNGQDAQRLAVQDPLAEAVPETYRVDPALEYLPGEFGIPTGPFTFDVHYGDVPRVDQADLSEVRLGTDTSHNLWLLARTTTMDDANPATALLVLLDTAPGGTQHTVPFNSGLTTTKAETAIFVTGNHGFVADLSSGQITPLPPGSVATNASGYTNAIEARLPPQPGQVGVAVAAGLTNPTGDGFQTLNPSPNIANVAFRTNEPARDWWEKQQALALHDGTIDPFFTTADLSAMAAGANQRYVPGSGYHDRIFTSSPTISNESGEDGILQHYGLYLPTSYRRGTPSPVQWWFHFRGGNAHIAAAVAPGIIEQMGEDANSVVVTPDGRGTSRWYVGKSQVDFLEVWDDVHKIVSIDRNREYIAGHSMGGWASWLLPILYPDRFAAAFPASGPLTQGLWVGCDNPDQCLQQPQNGGRVKDEWITPLIPNLRWVPYVNYQGAADELVWASGVTAQMEKMREAGFRYEYFVFPHEEHYGPPIFDQWAEGVKYEHGFVRDPNPPEFTYIRSMPLEHAVEQVQSDNVPLNFDFDHAYWMSDLQPVDANGTARFDGKSLAIPEPTHDVVPVTGPPATPDQPDPAVMEGQAWQVHPGTEQPSRNAFVITLTGANTVMLDLTRMRIQTTSPIAGDVTTEAPLRLELSGVWKSTPTATIDGAAVPVEPVSSTVVAVQVPAGHHTVGLTLASNVR
jgi:pimeloyl-ACP methyl ester carboxylesterase